MTRTQPFTLGHAGLALACAAAVVSVPIGLGIIDNREGHSWCDGTSIAVERPVSECMAQYNTFGVAGVLRWAKPYARAALIRDGYDAPGER